MTATLSRLIVRAARGYTSVTPEVIEKVKMALLDLLSCAFEARDNPPSLQAIEIARRVHGKSPVIGTAVRTSASEAAFANAVLAHGLVREDMHIGSVSHLGVVIFPALLALACRKRVSGCEFIRAVVCGYETGAAVGRAVMDRETVRRYRPTGITGPLGAAVAGSMLTGLSENASVSALGLAANTVSGWNEWPASGTDEMFFHVGFAARNAVTSVDLAALGACASETALDGPAGLFAALGRRDRAAEVRMFADEPEILSVYHKPAPACNYAQTACQVARELAVEDHVQSRDIAAINVRASAAALNYPGCNATGPFERILQAKMSIQYCVAATLVRGAIEEANYRLLADPEVKRLIHLTSLEEGPEFTAAYPRLQGTEIVLTFENGNVVRRRLEDVVPATPAEIRARFHSPAIESIVDSLEQQEDVRGLVELLGAEAA
jgi:2-methylcitrate dehydratase PrpD